MIKKEKKNCKNSERHILATKIYFSNFGTPFMILQTTERRLISMCATLNNAVVTTDSKHNNFFQS